MATALADVDGKRRALLGGGVIGVVLSVWATRAAAVFRLAAPVPLDLSLSVNSSVLLYAFILSVCAGILFGLVAARLVLHPLIGGRLSVEQMLRRSGSICVYEIIGVAKDTKSRTWGEEVRPVLYRSVATAIGAVRPWRATLWRFAVRAILLHWLTRCGIRSTH